MQQGPERDQNLSCTYCVEHGLSSSHSSRAGSLLPSPLAPELIRLDTEYRRKREATPLGWPLQIQLGKPHIIFSW